MKCENYIQDINMDIEIDGVWGIYAPNPNYPVCYNCMHFNMLEVRHKPVKIGSGDIMYEEWYFCPHRKQNINIWSNNCYPQYKKSN